MASEYAKNKALIKKLKEPKIRNVDFKLSQAGFESSLPDQPADVNQINKRLNQFRRPDDQLPVMNEQGDFVKDNKRGPITAFQDVIPRLVPEKMSTFDILYKAADPKEKADFRKRFPDYNFATKKFRKDEEKAKKRLQNFSYNPGPSIDMLKLTREVAEMKRQSKIAEEKFREAMKPRYEEEPGGLAYLMGEGKTNE